MKKYIVIILCVLGMHMHAHTQPSEGFVTFATSNYFDLLKVTLDSAHEFSTRPVIAYGINAEIPFDTAQYPRLIKRRLDVDLSKVHIFFIKVRIILESGLDYGVYIEADDILNKGVDTLFDVCKTIQDYPLCPLHPKDPENQYQIMKLMGVTHKSMPYVHAHILFSHTCRAFLQEWYEACLKYGRKAPNFDETILNVLLWKYGATQYLPVYDPYFESIQAWRENRIPYEHGYTQPDIHYYMLHGCKNHAQAAYILEQLKQYAQQD
ncbi:MAG: hypothetical protein ACOYT8_00170 [Candidatus Dependentiae bacterium]